MRAVRLANLIAHPFELAVSVFFFAQGLSLVLSGFQLSDSYPTYLVAGWAVALVLGGPCIAFGAVWGGGVGRAVERAGLLLAISTWITFTIALVGVAGFDSLLNMLAALAFTAGCVGRVFTLHQLDRAEDAINRPREE